MKRTPEISLRKAIIKTMVLTIWKPEYVNQAMDKLIRFFGATLA